MNAVARFLSARSPLIVASVAGVLTILLIFLQRSTALPSTIWALQLIPAGIAAVYAGPAWGVALALAGAIGERSEGAALSSALQGAHPGPAELALRFCILAGSALLLAELNRRLRSLRAELLFDSSSGLVHGPAFHESVRLEIERAQRYGRAFTIAQISVENYSVLRSRTGEVGAEGVLRSVAHLIRGSLRTSDVVSRLREHEFAVLLPETGAEAGEIVLARLRRNLSVSTDDQPSALWFAIGATTWLSSDITVQELSQQTYQLMHRARTGATNLQHEVLGQDGANPVPHPKMVLHRARSTPE